MASRLLDIFENKNTRGGGGGGVFAAGGSCGDGVTKSAAEREWEHRPFLASSSLLPQQQQQQLSFPNAVELNQLWLQALSSNNHQQQQQQQQEEQEQMMRMIMATTTTTSESHNVGAMMTPSPPRGVDPILATTTSSGVAVAAPAPATALRMAKISPLPSIVKPVAVVDRNRLQQQHVLLPSTTNPVAAKLQLQQQQLLQHQQIKIKQAQQQERRKCLNRLHAKQSRENKKNLQHTLQQELMKLQRQNQKLRSIVQTEIQDESIVQSILKECCKHHPLEEIAKLQGGDGASTSTGSSSSKDLALLHGSDFALIENLIKSRQSFVITDPRQVDHPIVYASEAFYKLTGYNKKQTIGRNCRFLQGVNTDQRSLDNIRKTIEITMNGNGGSSSSSSSGNGNGGDASINVLNYKADGTPFWNQLFIAPLRNKEKMIVNYVS